MKRMLVNRKNKWKSKLVSLSLATALIATAGAAGAASTSASLDGSSTYKDTAIITASSNSTGNIYATNTGANTQTRGYGYKSIDWWPDSIVASTNWLNPGQAERSYFTQTKGDKYYGQIVGQTVGSRGSVTITVQ
jgi:PhoPQ-activated pathogenicity-related protein